MVNWNALRGEAKAFKNPAAPPGLAATALSFNAVTSRFELTANDPHIRFGMELGIEAELTDAGAATIAPDAEIAEAGTPVMTLSTSLHLQLDHTNPQMIKIDGGQPGHTQMPNGGHQSETWPDAPALAALNAGNYELTFKMTIQSDGFAENVTADATVHVH